MKLISCTTATDVAARAADEVAAALARDPEAVLVLPAGNTPRPLFAELVRRHAAGTLEAGRAHVVQLDELVGVSPDDPRSFHAFLRAHLLDPLGRDGSRDHLLRGDAPDPAAEIARHAEAVAALGRPDLVVLGIGLNGHVAFNEPGTNREDGARLLDLAPTTLAGLGAAFDEHERPTRGITLGLRELRAGRTIRILATGVNKAAIIARLLDGEPSSEVPASLLAPHADLAVLVDRASADAAGSSAERG